MQQYKLIATYGFAIFTMFFGSGNLVFPLSIGYYSANSWLLGFLGLLLTGVVLPFLGLFVIKLHKGCNTCMERNVTPLFYAYLQERGV